MVCPLEGRHQSLIAKTSRRYELLLRFFQFLKDEFEDLKIKCQRELGDGPFWHGLQFMIDDAQKEKEPFCFNANPLLEMKHIHAKWLVIVERINTRGKTIGKQEKGT